MKQNNSSFEEPSIAKLVLKNVLPAMMAMLMALIYNLADIFFIGQTGNDYLVASVSLATPVFLIFMALGSLFGMGGTAVISRSLGEGRVDYARKVCSFCMWGSIIVGIITSLVMWLSLDGILHILGASDITFEYTKNYLSIVIGCGTFSMISNCYSNVLRAEGKSTLAMWGILLGNLINIIFDPILIFRLDLGIRGAAIATFIGNAFGAIFYIIYFFIGKSSLSIRLRDFSIRDRIAVQVLSIGFPATVNSLLMSLSQIIINSEFAKFGDMEVAAYGVAAKLLMIVASMSLGIGQGIQPVLGYCYGAGQKKRFKDCLRFGCIMAGIVCGVLAVLVIVFINPIVNIFLTDQSALELGIRFTIIMISVDWIFGIISVLTNALQAAGAALPALIISFSRQGLIFIPVILIMGMLNSMNGLVLAQPISDIATLILSMILFQRTYRRQLN